jgi:isopentenyldiphosphate isomerase
MTDQEYHELTRSRTSYEWGVEFVTKDGHEDIDDTYHYESLKQAKEEKSVEYTCRIVLIREQGSEDEGVTDRQWAYLKNDGTLPEEFDGGTRVPKKFHAEAERNK